jgi:hypothetical protein
MMRSFMISTLHKMLLGYSRTGQVARMEEIRNAYKILVGKIEGKRPFGNKVVNGKY